MGSLSRLYFSHPSKTSLDYASSIGHVRDLLATLTFVVYCVSDRSLPQTALQHVPDPRKQRHACLLRVDFLRGLGPESSKVHHGEREFCRKEIREEVSSSSRPVSTLTLR